MSVTLMEGRGLQRAVEVIQEKFVPTMTANYTVRTKDGATVSIMHLMFAIQFVLSGILVLPSPRSAPS
jgi:hypothetical protein